MVTSLIAVAAAFTAHRRALDAVAVLVCKVIPGAMSASAHLTLPTEDPCSHTRWCWCVHPTGGSAVHRHQRASVPVHVAYMDTPYILSAYFFVRCYGEEAACAWNGMPRPSPSACMKLFIFSEQRVLASPVRPLHMAPLLPSWSLPCPPGLPLWCFDE